MSRSLRLLALTTALAISVTLVPGNASADTPTAGSESATTSATAPEVSKSAALDPDLKAAERLTASHRRAPKTSTRAISVPIGAGATLAPSARQAPSGKAVSNKWPVRLRTGFAVNHAVTPSGDPSQNISSARITADRGPKALYVDLILRGVPTSATDAQWVAGFGKVKRSADGSAYCDSPAGANLAGSTAAFFRGSNRLRVYDIRSSMDSLGWNCVVSAILASDGSARDYVLSGKIANVREQPAFGVVVRRASLTSSRYKKIKVQIRNSPRVIATAPNVRLRVITRGPITVKYRKKVGTLKPGQLRKGAILARLTGRGNGSITYIFRSKDYKVRLTTKVRAR